METVEDLWARSSESLRAHTESIRAHTETLRAHTRHASNGLWRSSENLKARSEELVANITVTLSEREQRIRLALSNGLIANMSEGLFERQRALADSLRQNLTLKLKVFIIIFLIFGFQRYVQTEATDISLLFFIISLVAYILHRISTAPSPPELFFKQSDWMTELLEHCPKLLETYRPPVLWGWNGHIQTAVLGKMGRSINPALPLVRRSLLLEDGATVFYDTFDPPFAHATANIIIVPGLANTSEKLYIKTFVRYALMEGFRVIVLNHLGALKDQPITSPRIFGYGHTVELASVVDVVYKKYRLPQILVGFSMGGNIAAKYLCEKPDRQSMFIGLVTVCQGYDITLSESYLLSWERLGRLYNWAMTNGALKTTINRHGKLLYSIYDQAEVASATCLQDIDNSVIRKMYNFDTLEEMYTTWSCSTYLSNMNIPALFLNAADDPIISPKCTDIPINFAQSKDKIIHVQTQCGGHLGFFTGGWLVPDAFSWLDSTVVEYCNALLLLSKQQQSDTDSDYYDIVT